MWTSRLASFTSISARIRAKASDDLAGHRLGTTARPELFLEPPHCRSIYLGELQVTDQRDDVQIHVLPICSRVDRSRPAALEASRQDAPAAATVGLLLGATCTPEKWRSE